jgi:hypothetical protein
MLRDALVLVELPGGKIAQYRVRRMYPERGAAGRWVLELRAGDTAPQTGGRP